MTVNLKARTPAPGTCAMKGCTIPASKIFEDDTLRILACTQGHAQAVSDALSRPPAGMTMETYRERLPGALLAFNAGATKRAAPVEDDYDIDY